jgi:hypothetical protein
MDSGRFYFVSQKLLFLVQDWFFIEDQVMVSAALFGEFLGTIRLISSSV